MAAHEASQLSVAMWVDHVTENEQKIKAQTEQSLKNSIFGNYKRDSKHLLSVHSAHSLWLREKPMGIRQKFWIMMLLKRR